MEQVPNSPHPQTARDHASLRSPSVAEHALLKKYAPLVRRVAYALRGMRPAPLDQDDAFQDGMIGLLRAIRSDNSGTDAAQFSVFARSNIRGAIIDGYRAAGNMSRSDYAKAKKTRRAVMEGETVSPSERAQADQIFSAAWTPAQSIGNEDHEGDVLADPYPGPEQRAMANQLLRRVVDVLQHTPIRDRTIFIACELDGEKQIRVAERLDLSYGRVSQILKRVRQEIIQAIA